MDSPPVRGVGQVRGHDEVGGEPVSSITKWTRTMTGLCGRSRATPLSSQPYCGGGEPKGGTRMHSNAPPSHTLNERRDSASEEALIRRVAHQLRTTAGLTITDAQGKRLCGLESGVWDRVLIDLVERGVLVPSSDDTYAISRTVAGLP